MLLFHLLDSIYQELASLLIFAKFNLNKVSPDSRLTPEHPDAQIIDGVLPAYDVPESALSDYLRPDWSDACINVRTEEAYETAHEVLRAEGLFLGTSAAAALHAAVQVGRRPENQGKNIVVIVPDNGMKYLSTPMYRQK